MGGQLSTILGMSKKYEHEQCPYDCFEWSFKEATNKSKYPNTNTNEYSL